MKTKHTFELDPERLGTTDESGNRVYLYPEDVKGVWKERRKRVYWFLIALYLILPWIYVDQKPSLLIDLQRREFTFFGNTLYGVEPVLFFLLVASGLFLIAFLTSLLGRVWCGWACPQTVFIQAIFWRIEELTEGSARRRRELAQAPWDLNKALRFSLKWMLFLLVSLHIAHTFIGYFVGPRELLLITLQDPAAHWGLFLATMTLSAIFLVDFGWFREQFCIIMCPYGRIQSVMMDENSLVVSYDAKRGEPRRTSVPADAPTGDCINCYHCVKVCPTGIDIRRGTQLECIACTQCIDACDEIMTKLKKPLGLISYSSENQVRGLAHKKLTPRSMLYAGIGVLLVVSFAYFLGTSSQLRLVFLRSVRPYVVASETQLISNQFVLKMLHQGGRTLSFNLRVVDPELRPRVEIITPLHPIVADVAEKKAILFLRFDRSLLVEGRRRIWVEAISTETSEVLSKQEVTLVGPDH